MYSMCWDHFLKSWGDRVGKTPQKKSLNRFFRTPSGNVRCGYIWTKNNHLKNYVLSFQSIPLYGKISDRLRHFSGEKSISWKRGLFYIFDKKGNLFKKAPKRYFHLLFSKVKGVFLKKKKVFSSTQGCLEVAKGTLSCPKKGFLFSCFWKMNFHPQVAYIKSKVKFTLAVKDL